MKTKIALLLFTAMSILAFPLLVEAGKSFQAVPEKIVDFETIVNVPLELHKPILDALNADKTLISDSEFTVSYMNTFEAWAYIVLVPTRIVKSFWESDFSSRDIVNVLAIKQADRQWVAVANGHPNFVSVARNVPTEWMDFSYLWNIESETRQSPFSPSTAVNLLFPWPAGQNWYKTQGWHSGTPPLALDFQPVVRTNPSEHFAVLAAEQGVMSIDCGGVGTNDLHQVQIRVTHSDGSATLYWHLDANTIRYDLVGKSVARGQFLGLLYNGTVGGGGGNQYLTLCGRGTAVHLHFVVPFQGIIIDVLNSNDVAISPFATEYRSSNIRIENGGYTKPLTGDFTGDNLSDSTVFQGMTGEWLTGVSSGNAFGPATNWIAGHGVGSQNQLVGDFNGDGKDDSAVYFGSEGTWYVALSNGSGFNGYTQWITGHGVGSQNQLVGDFNGDGKADGAVYFGNEGTWYVALSNGNGFNGYAQWTTGHGVGSQNQLIGDFNGDGKDDSAVYFSNEGTWYVALSNGSGFNGYTQWITGHGVGSQNQLIGDFNGDGKDDSAVYFGNEGTWYVALSNGNGFNGYTQWITGHGIGSQNQLIGDFNGDGKADSAVYFINGNEWYIALSTGTGFANYSLWRNEATPDIEMPKGNDCIKPLLRYYHPGLNDHFYTVSWDELGPGKDGWIYENVAGYVAISKSCYVPNASPIYRYNYPETGNHFYTLNWGELGGGGNGWVYEGIAGYALAAADAEHFTQPLYRYYNSTIRSHFYTISWSELGTGGDGWLYEEAGNIHVFTAEALIPRGTGCLKPFLRYYHPDLNDHFYTIDWNELGIGKDGWIYEGVEGYIAITSDCYAPGAASVYRYYNAAAGNHFYTMDWSELGSGNADWTYEGVAGYALAAENSQYHTLPLYRYYNLTINSHFYTTAWYELEAGQGDWIYERIAAHLFGIDAIQSVAATVVPVAGSALFSQVDNTKYLFPQDTFTNTVTFIHNQRFMGSYLSLNGKASIGHIFETIAADSSTDIPINPISGKSYTITIGYNVNDLSGVVESSISLYHWTGSEWVKEDSSLLNTEKNKVTANLTHSGLWALLGEKAYSIYLPLVLR